MQARPAAPIAALLLHAALNPAALPGQTAEPLSTDRPDFTEGAATLAPGRFQVEAGYTFAREGAEGSHTLGEALVRIGLSRRLELRAALNSYVRVERPAGGEDGFEDVSLGVKLKLAEAPPRFHPLRPDAALLLASTLPTGTSGFGEDGFQPEVKLALAWDLSERLSLGSNLNFAYASEGGDRFSQFSASVVLGTPIDEKFSSYVELFGFAPLGPDGSAASFLNAGVTIALSEDLQLDGRAGLGLNDPDPNYFAGLGFALRR